jgi:hypothetical protein
MILVKLQGGLGNQMFQYAMGRAVSIRKTTNLLLDTEWFKKDSLRIYSLDVFFAKQDFATPKDINRFLKFKRKKGLVGRIYNPLFARFDRYASERGFHYDSGIFDISNDAYLDGYWNTEKYFKDIRPTLLKDFTVKTALSGKNKEAAEQITKTNSVSIHIRRGDYANNPSTRIAHGLLDASYYEKAFAYIHARVDNPKVFIFSDDMPWVKNNLAFNAETTYIDWNDAEHAYEDLRLMSLCKHNIIANSTFSWWGAWLSQNEHKIVIGPQKWFNQLKPSTHTRDVMPESWIRI